MKAIFFDLDGTLGGHGLGNGQYLEKLWKRSSPRSRSCRWEMPSIF